MLLLLFPFSLFNFVGDPVISLTGEDSSIERQAEVREAIGLNDPVYIQFSRFLGNVIQGDFGISYQLKREVSDLIAERMPATLELVFVSAMLAIIVGVILGFIQAFIEIALFQILSLLFHLPAFLFQHSS